MNRVPPIACNDNDDMVVAHMYGYQQKFGSERVADHTLRQPLSHRRGQPLIFLISLMAFWICFRLYPYWPSYWIHLDTRPDYIRMSAPAKLRQPTGREVVSPYPDAHRFSGNRASAAAGEARFIRHMPESGAEWRTQGQHHQASPAQRAKDYLLLALQQKWLEQRIATSPGETGPHWLASPGTTRARRLDGKQDPDNSAQGPYNLSERSFLASGRKRSGWHLYMWLFYRHNQDHNSLASSFLPYSPVYGGSQAGLMVRRDLAASSPLRPQLFARLASALNDSDMLVAGGLSVRPIADLPVELAVEGRVALDGGAQNGLALWLAGGADYHDRQRGFTLSGYGQAGLIRPHDPVLFFDARAEAGVDIVHNGRNRVNAALGLWTGGQENSERTTVSPATAPPVPQQQEQMVWRLDSGPQLSWQREFQHGHARLSLGWRQQLAGNARPDNGLVVTLSSGF